MKIFLQNLIKKFLLIFGIGIYVGESKQNLKKFIKKFQPFDLGYNLIRIGSRNDGGYLIPNILDKIDFCISPGVDKTVLFEKQLLHEYKIKSYLIDHTVDENEKFLQEFDFTKKKLGIISNEKETNLEDFYNKKIINKSKNGILQIDIEGDEYKVLLSTSNEILKKFKILIVEFHNLDKINHKFNYSVINSLLDKILKNFDVSHVHPNNFSGKINFFKDVSIPEIIEVTFLRKDLIKKKSEIKVLPHPLDARNVINKKDIYLNNFI